MLFVDPQGAATLGNKGNHCLLHKVSQHQIFILMFGFRQFSVIGSTSIKYNIADHYLTSLANVQVVGGQIFNILSQNFTLRCLHYPLSLANLASPKTPSLPAITGKSGKSQDASKR